jgi:ATP-binding cassette subfamily F protein 3
VRKAYGDLVVFPDLNLHIERGDRIALVGPNGAGKSTLMRMLSGEELPDHGERAEGHNVVMQYFAQDEATRMDPNPTVHDTLSSGSPMHMVPMIRNILGGFLFSGDDIYKKVRVLSGGERTRLAVARMLLRPSNTLLLDEPTNHLDLDSKEVLLDALVDYGGTLIFVSHDRYFVERLATKIVEVGSGPLLVYPGTYKEFLWHKEHPDVQATSTPREKTPAASAKPASAAKAPAGSAQAPSARGRTGSPPTAAASAATASQPPQPGRDERKRLDAEARKLSKAKQARKAQVDALEARIAETEAAIRDLETRMSAPGFYDDRSASQKAADEHQALMWKVGELMQRWEDLQADPDLASTTDR